MAILATDIKLLKSERMADTSDGGGRRTSVVIVDGSPGNIFPKVSRYDTTYGRDNLRKIFGHVDTNNVDVYAGAHVVLLDGPDNDRIHVVIFATNSDYDTRTAARDRIESFVIAGPESRMTMYGRQLQGQGAIMVLQRVEDALPDVGAVLCLSNEPGGVITTQQYVKIEDVGHEIRTFTDSTGDFQRRLLNLRLSAVLRYEFTGVETATRFQPGTAGIPAPTSKVRSTNFVDAARYFGIADIAEAAAAGDLTVHLASIYSPIVPTTQREAPIANASIEGARTMQAAVNVPWPFYQVGTAVAGNIIGISTTQTINLGRAVKPGSFKAYLPGYNGTPNSATATDDGNGVIPAANNGSGGSIAGGTINYETGVFTLTGTYAGTAPDSTAARRFYVSFEPSVVVQQTVHTRELEVTLATRGTVYVQTLAPLPHKGTVFVDFRSLGKWYRLRDDGTGALKGTDPAHGTGSLDPVTGSLVVTLGALPDVGSSVLFGWSSTIHHTVRAGTTTDADNVARLKYTLPQLPVKPATLVVTYTVGAGPLTAAADANGVINANGLTGTVNHATGEVEIAFNLRLPNQNTLVNFAYQKEVPSNPEAPTSTSGTATLVAGDLNFISAANVATKGFKIQLPVLVQAVVNGPTSLIQIPAVDNGAGAIVTTHLEFEALGRRWRHAGGTNVGTINYATGAIALTGPVSIDRLEYFPGSTAGSGVTGFITTPAGWSVVPRIAVLQDGDYAWTARLTNASTGTAVTVTPSLADAPITIDVTKTVTSAVVPGSLTFVAYGKQYIDRDGKLYIDMLPDGTATEAGTFNYATGQAAPTKWVDQAAPGISVSSCLTRQGNYTAFAARFRTAGSPIRPASSFVQVTAADGAVLTATSDVNGVLSGAQARGSVNHEMGILAIEWGEMVAAAGNEEEPWYAPEAVEGGMVWKPRAVQPETIRYNTVVLSNLPLNADLLGLDPTRLPSDGRVPIFRAGDVVLVHHTDLTEVEAVAGATVSVGRTGLAALALVDDEGTPVPESLYTTDLAAGTVTFDDPLDLGDLELPLHAKHRIEEMRLCADVQINGDIGLAAPLSRAYPEGSRVSSALPFGDLFARVTGVFDQQTWTNVWSDTRIGSQATGEYNTIDFPILVTNSAAVSDRWRISFNTSAAFDVISENLGVIASGTTAVDCAPNNPLTGKPYFTLRAAGWGGGWAAGNQVRFNTVAAAPPFWLNRCVLPGATLSGDSIDVQLRGDVDA